LYYYCYYYYYYYSYYYYYYSRSKPSFVYTTADITLTHFKGSQGRNGLVDLCRWERSWRKDQRGAEVVVESYMGMEGSVHHPLSAVKKEGEWVAAAGIGNHPHSWRSPPVAAEAVSSVDSATPAVQVAASPVPLDDH